MSVINEDSKVVQDGRKNVLKDSKDLQVKASLRDQITQKLYDFIKKEGMGEKLVKQWYLGNANRANWLERQQEYLSDWDEFLVSSDNGAFEGSSSLHMPMPFIVAKTLHARFLQALLGIDPPFTLRPRRSDSVERSTMVQELMEYAIKDWSNNQEGSHEVLDDWVWQWITTGCGILKLRWDVQFTRFIDVEQRQVAKPPKSQVDEQGNEVLVPQFKMEEKEVAKTIKKFEGPVFECIDNDDFLMVKGEGNPQRADSCIHRSFLTASQLWTFVDREVFNKDAVTTVIERGKDTMGGADTGAIKFQQAFNSGASQVDSESQLDRYEILECYTSMDVDGSGINSEVVVWVHKRSREILRATYLNRINKTGMRPFFKIDFYRRKGQEYGIGIIEILHPLSIEMDAMHNMRIDFGLLSAMPFGFYRPTSTLVPETIELSPGALIPLDNPQTDVYFPNLGNRSAFGAQEEAALQQTVERLTGISDLNLGVIGAQGATRTSTGVRALLGEQNANLDVHLRRLNAGWKKALTYLLHMLQQRLPDGFEFRLLGDDGDNYFAYIKNRDDIQGDFDFEVSPNSSTSNQQILLENAQQIMQLTANPLDIQLGIINPDTRYEALRNYLCALGVKDYGKFIKTPPQHQRIFSPQEEVQRLLRGIDTPVTAQSDNEGFLDYFDHLQKTPEIFGQFNAQEIQAIAMQAKKHELMLKAMTDMAAQQRNAQQMQQNAAQSQQQSSPGMNPMAGGPGPNAAPTQAPQ